jgi:signal transduction histidine kinase
LFTKFTTRSEKGTGLGLYICERIIEAHGGKIGGENNVEKKNITGTIVTDLWYAYCYRQISA